MTVPSANDPTAHAEIVAIRRACGKLARFDLRGCEIYASCEPCPMCLAAIYWARLDRVWFAATRNDAAAAGFDDAVLYEQIALPIERRSIPTAILAREDAQTPFRAWREAPCKTPY
jgi:guanine deaminase